MTNRELMAAMQSAGRLHVVHIGNEKPNTKTPKEIAASLTRDQQNKCRESLGEALDIVSAIVGEMPYSSLFTITCAVIEEL